MRAFLSHTILLLTTLCCLIIGATAFAGEDCGGQTGTRDCSPGGTLATRLAQDASARIARTDVGTVSAGDNKATFTVISVSFSTNPDQVIKAFQVRLEGKGRAATAYLDPDKLGIIDHELSYMADHERATFDRWRAEDAGRAPIYRALMSMHLTDDESGNALTLGRALSIGIYESGPVTGVAFEVSRAGACKFLFPGLSLAKIAELVRAGRQKLAR